MYLLSMAVPYMHNTDHIFFYRKIYHVLTKTHNIKLNDWEFRYLTYLEKENIPGHEPLFPCRLHLFLEGQGVRDVAHVVALNII